MFTCFRSRLFAFVLATGASCAFVGAADAGWVTIKNDTSKAIIVQETITLKNGTVVRGKPTKLLPGESFREFQNVPGNKSYEVLDPVNNTQPIWTGILPCKSDNQSFSFVTVQGKVGVVQIPEPKKK